MRKLFNERKLFNGGSYMRKYGKFEFLNIVASAQKKERKGEKTVNYCFQPYFFGSK